MTSAAASAVPSTEQTVLVKQKSPHILFGVCNSSTHPGKEQESLFPSSKSTDRGTARLNNPLCQDTTRACPGYRASTKEKMLAKYPPPEGISRILLIQLGPRSLSALLPLQELLLVGALSPFPWRAEFFPWRAEFFSLASRIFLSVLICFGWFRSHFSSPSPADFSACGKEDKVSQSCFRSVSHRGGAGTELED